MCAAASALRVCCEAAHRRLSRVRGGPLRLHADPKRSASGAAGLGPPRSGALVRSDGGAGKRRRRSRLYPQSRHRIGKLGAEYANAVGERR